MIELIIVIIIITTLSSVSLSSYGTFNETKKLDKTATELISVLELAKKKSIALDKNLTISGTDYSACSLTNYHVSVISSTQYSLGVNLCTTGACPFNAGCQDLTIASYTIPVGTTLSPTGTVTFTTRTGIATGITSVVITRTNLNKTKTVNISGSGIIE